MRPRLALFALVVMAVAMPAAAQERRGIDRWFEAADRFEALAVSASARNRVPRLNERAARPVLRRLTDARATFGDERYVVADAERLGRMLERTMVIAQLYLQHGIDPGSASPETQSEQTENIVTYQSELLPLLAFTVDTGARIAASHAPLFASGAPIAEPTRLNLIQTRGGIAQIVRGLLFMGGEPALAAESRLLALQALARNAARLAATFTIAERGTILAAAREIRSGAQGDEAAALDALIREMETPDCAGFCVL